MRTRVVVVLLSLSFGAWVAAWSIATEPPKGGDLSPLPGTKPLDWTGDIASRMVNGADKFLLDEIENSVKRRQRAWTEDMSTPQKRLASIESRRKRLAAYSGCARSQGAIRRAGTGGDDECPAVGRTRQKLPDLRRALAGTGRRTRRRPVADPREADRGRGGNP